MTAEQVNKMQLLKQRYGSGNLSWDEYQKEAHKLEDDMKGRKPAKVEKK